MDFCYYVKGPFMPISMCVCVCVCVCVCFALFFILLSCRCSYAWLYTISSGFTCGTYVRLLHRTLYFSFRFSILLFLVGAGILFAYFANISHTPYRHRFPLSFVDLLPTGTESPRPEVVQPVTFEDGDLHKGIDILIRRSCR